MDERTLIKIGIYTVELWLTEDGGLGLTIEKDGIGNNPTPELRDVIIDFDKNKAVMG